MCCYSPGTESSTICFMIYALSLTQSNVTAAPGHDAWSNAYVTQPLARALFGEPWLAAGSKDQMAFPAFFQPHAHLWSAADAKGLYIALYIAQGRRGWDHMYPTSGD